MEAQNLDNSHQMKFLIVCDQFHSYELPFLIQQCLQLQGAFWENFPIIHLFTSSNTFIIFKYIPIMAC